MKVAIWISIFVGYFVLRFGMVSRGRSREIIQFIGGIILTICFILSFLFLGLKAGFLNILIFWALALKHCSGDTGPRQGGARNYILVAIVSK